MYVGLLLGDLKMDISVRKLRFGPTGSGDYRQIFNSFSTWADLGLSWARMEGILEPSCGLLGAPWKHLRMFVGVLGASSTVLVTS